MKLSRPKPLLLLILDGWGYRQEKNHNAIALAPTPHWDQLIKSCPHTLLTASGLSVGLPEGQMGNSEVGHLTIGSGRTIYQDLTRINQAIDDKTFFENKVLLEALKKAQRSQKKIHLLGLVSPGGIHSHEKQLYALLELFAQHHIKNVYIHAFLDGRDTPPQSAEASLKRLEKKLGELKVGSIASIMGRYYAMDRDQRWDRTQAAYDCLTQGKAKHHANDAINALQQAYARGESDEFVQPTCIHASNQAAITIQNGDSVFFINFRADRARQLSRALLCKEFSGFKRQVHPELTEFVSLTQYATDIPSQIAFPQQTIKNGLADYLSKQGLTQLHIAETEKYAHVTFFFNGGLEKPFSGEERILIPSKKVTTYDLAPFMSVEEITQQLMKAIREKTFDVIICNFANPDMLGHTGNQAATEKAITCVDTCIGQIVDGLKQFGGEAIITADHGNAECMYDEKNHQAHTAHTTEPVPFIYIGRPVHIAKKDNTGTLADIAPTLLYILDLPIPKEMTGKSLVQFL